MGGRVSGGVGTYVFMEKQENIIVDTTTNLELGVALCLPLVIQWFSKAREN